MADILSYLFSMTLAHYIGLLGVFLYIGSFAAVQLGWLSGDGIAFSIFNVSAALCVAVNLMVEFNLSSMIIQAAFATIGIVGILRRVWNFPPADPVEPLKTSKRFDQVLDSKARKLA